MAAASGNRSARLWRAAVVLSACDSATGFVLSGEGPLSLARAFFAGGASGVVATRGRCATTTRRS